MDEDKDREELKRKSGWTDEQIDNCQAGITPLQITGKRSEEPLKETEEIVTWDNIMTRRKVLDALSKGKILLVANKENVPTEKFRMKLPFIDFVMWEYENTDKGFEDADAFGKKHSLRRYEIYRNGEFIMSVG